MANDCLFCKILAGDIPSDKVYENEYVYAFRDINPGAPTHVLVIPKKHIKDVASIQADDSGLMGEIMLAVSEIARIEGLKDFRLVANNGAGAGQSVFHLHFHVLGGRSLSWPPG